MDNFYMTQRISIPFEESPNKIFSKTNYNFYPLNTFKSEATNYTTFQKTKLNSAKNENNYKITKIQCTIISDFLSKMNLINSLKIFDEEIKNILNLNTLYTFEEMSKFIEIKNNNNEKNKNDIPSETIKTTYLFNLLFNSKTNIFEKNNKSPQKNISKKNNDNDNEIDNYLSDINNISINPNFFEDLNEKLRKIDEKYDSKRKVNNANILPQKNALETKFMRYKKELNEKYKEDMQKEIERIKSMEIGKAVIEQNKKYLEKIESIRNEYESKFEIKNKELIEKQKALKEKENELELNNIQKAKELMQEYQKKEENLIQKENDFNQKCLKELNNINEQKKELDKKDRELFILKKDFYKELEKEIEKLKVEFKQIYKEQIQKIHKEKEQQIEKLENELKLSKMSNIFNSSLNSNINVTNQINEECLKNLLELKQKLGKLKSENRENQIALNKRIIPASDKEEEKAKLDIIYFDKINEIESEMNLVANKFKYKHFNSDVYKINENINSELIVKDIFIKNKLDELNNIQNEFDKEFKKELNEFKIDTPDVRFTKEEIDQIKENKFKIVLTNLEQEKQLNEMYKKQNEKEKAENKIKYINEINNNLRSNYEAILDQNNIKIIDKNEMDNHKKMYLKLYRYRREEQFIAENKHKAELLKNMEFIEKIKDKNRKVSFKEKDKETSKDKKIKDEDRSQYSKSIALPPVKNPKEKKLLKSSNADEIEELIHKSKIRIAENKEDKEMIEQKQLKEKIKLTGGSQEEDEYGSGDFYDFSNDDKKSKKDKSRAENSSTNKSNKLMSNTTNKENLSDDYNDFETTKALNKQGINTELSSNHDLNKSHEDSKF